MQHDSPAFGESMVVELVSLKGVIGRQHMGPPKRRQGL